MVLNFCNGLTYSTLPDDVQITFDTSRLDAVFLEKGSSEEAKYELFVRLNTYGQRLERQQVRDCYIIASENGTGYFKNVIEKLSKLNEFKKSLTLSEKKIKASFANELVIRFLTMANPQYQDSLSRTSSVLIHDWLDRKILEKVKGDSDDIKNIDINVFTKTFEILSQLEGDALCRFDVIKDKFIGNTTLKAFEFVAIGLGYNVYKAEEEGREYNLTKEELTNKIKAIWESAVELEDYKGYDRTYKQIKKGCDTFRIDT